MEKSLEDRIVEQVLGAIADQRLPAGAKLGEQALSDLFSCNRAQVRRALTALAAHGVVDLFPNRGAFVATPTAEEARDVFQARRAIETSITRNVVKRATADDIERLRRHVKDEHAITVGEGRRTAIRMSRDFHLKLAQIGGNRILERYLAELTMRTSLIIGLYGSTETSACADDEHKSIVEAIAAGDVDGALMAIDQHLRHIEDGVVFERKTPQGGLLSSILVPANEPD